LPKRRGAKDSLFIWQMNSYIYSMETETRYVKNTFIKTPAYLRLNGPSRKASGFTVIVTIMKKLDRGNDTHANTKYDIFKHHKKDTTKYKSHYF
jgi:hypothetical protein